MIDSTWLSAVVIAVAAVATFVRVVLPLLVLRFLTPQLLWRGF
ncbi:MAG: hypothetical protein ABEJ26_14860 [Halosimplex sp.]